MPRKSKKDKEFEQKYWERRARERVAWGTYGALVRQKNFDRQLSTLKTREEREQFIRKGEEENARGFYVG